MCRIFGFNGQDKDVLDKMGAVLAPGGPDNYGSFESPEFSLGHRRLSIIDLSAEANQPMQFENLIISYNGEVYNYKKIQKELSEYIFTTSSDTEVILKAFHKWGIEAVQKFHGMFAIALYDKTTKKLTLIRDRAGVKPLYYYFDGKNFIFASELKALLLHPRFQKRIDPKAAALYLQFGFVPTPYSIFKNCHKLPAAHYLEFCDQKVTLKQYWDLPKQKMNIGFEEAKEKTRVLLQRSFEYRMVSDVEVGVFLSGGIDSSLLVSFLSKKYPLKTFTIGFEDKRFNEAKIAKETAKRLKTQHYELYFGIDELLNLLPTIANIFDEPFGDSSALPTLLVAKLAKEHVKVALSADGADELFGGYPINFKNYRRFSLYKNLRFIRFLLQGKRKYMTTDDYLEFKLATRYRIYPDELKEEIFFDELKCHELLECMFLFDFKHFLADDVLVKVDRVTMANSLEAREPYLDHALIEFAFSLPDNLRWHKKILRALLQEELPEISKLPKQGFSVPIKYWLRNQLKEQVLDTLEQNSFLDDVVNKDKIVKQFYKNGKRTNAIWLMYMFRLWEERYIK
ncbi:MULTISPECIES: asparagine synthase (glutamine-hydrolyzing) [unclassified Nitratiruptor]|uniref:asparagine synthase (glutamine-hydrolyzing) n=1 Tax=unclassified Nitratiruptor TaxID=2624044 RepID=UPI0019163A1D|nr:MULTISPECIES: asparagine synthase (glutamine-hydrolyzing) [unclassified Nitratiruptor]BCD60742.1 asparagine synthase (glutamine-hydrolysing) [Nitratiruptor sp. YY08-10]BCD64674.1 asparagine synthase (glutamine-hydrolysing) [Nitratiruptor sp. YY08-14]